MRAEAKQAAAPLPKELSGAKPRATIQLTRLAQEREAKKALETAEQGTPRATFSLSALFGFGSDENEEKTETKKKSNIPSAKTSRSPVVRTAPRGVPSIGRWRQNRDKSITGFISGSPAFSDGERVTTSPIAKGNVSAGEVVVTSSGTRYFLQ